MALNTAWITIFFNIQNFA